jgi:tetratricopeptide (TPR) repeat protein
VIPLLNDLAETYATRDDYGDAEPLFERSLEIQEGELSRYRAGIARTLNQLGAIYEATARPDRARQAYTRVLANLQSGLGVGDPSVQTARLRLAKLERLPPPPMIAVTPPTPPAAAPTAVAAPPAELAAVDEGYQVHLASVRRSGQAPDEWRRLQQAYPALLGWELRAASGSGSRAARWHAPRRGGVAANSPNAASGARCGVAPRRRWSSGSPPKKPRPHRRWRRPRTRTTTASI